MEWISVKDRLPEEVGQYLVLYRNARGFVFIRNATWTLSRWDEMLQKVDEGFSVQYWMPLPELPKEE